MKTRTRAFTLVELMIALTILGFVSIGLWMLVMSALKMHAFNSAQLSLVSDVRKITGLLAKNAEDSNYFVILPEYAAASRTKVEGSVTVLNKVDEGASGNCLVLVFKHKDDNTKIRKIMGYYWVKNATGTDGTLYMHMKDYGDDVANAVTGNLWTLMSPASSMGKDLRIADHVSSPSGVFYNFYGRSVIMNCQIVERATNYKNATVTYNFTVSPRG